MINFSRIFLFPFTFLYWATIKSRNFLYDHGILKTEWIGCRVVSIGNLSTGGTGKTPATVYIASLLQKKGFSVGILSRGYRRSTTGTLTVSDGSGNVEKWNDAGDEPVMIALQLPGVPVVVDEDRVRGGKFLKDFFSVDTVVLDDGFQHRRLHRDVDIVLISDPSGGTRFFDLLPTGNYREPFSSLQRASSIVFSRANIVPPRKKQIALAEKTGLPVFHFNLYHYFHETSGSNPSYLSLKEFGSKVVLVAGIGDPDSFISIVKKAGIHIVGERFFRDHYVYGKNDLGELRLLLKASEADFLLTTEKDFIRLEGLKPDFPIRVFPVRAESGDEEKLLKLLLG